jgi:hypothetical protein
MIFVRPSRAIPDKLWRPAMFLFAVSQFLLAFAPLAEGRFGKDAESHVEAAGTIAHHSHSTDCTACTARSILAAALPVAIAAPLAANAVVTVSLAELLDFSSSAQASSRPRAPPVRQA